MRFVLIAGLLFSIPLGVTFLILYSLFLLVDRASEPLIRAVFGYNIPGVGFVLTSILLYLAGLFISHFIGRRFAEFLQSLLTRLPGISFIYLSLRQLGRALTEPESPALKKVVYVRYPSPHMLTIGFVTSLVTIPSLGKLVGVYVPTPPNPTNGYFVLVPEQDVIGTEFTLEEGLKISFSAGLYWPETTEQTLSAGEKPSGKIQ